MKMKIIIILQVIANVQYAFGMTTLTIPSLVNCGDQAVLVCTSNNCTTGYRFRRNNSTIYSQSGPSSSTDKTRYVATVTSNSQVILNISNIQLSDDGVYTCSCGFEKDTNGHLLQYECRASTSTAEITSDKKLTITVDRLYPLPSNISTSLTYSGQLPGTYTCVPNVTLAFHYRCTWRSKTSQADGTHSYTMHVMTSTITPETSVSGSFSIANPTSTIIQNTTTITKNRQVLRGVENSTLTIQCVSSGGLPAPTLAWYRGNTSTSPLAQTNTSDSVQQLDGTYTVTLTHIFTPQREDDLKTFLCRVFYPGATNEASPNPGPASALLYLDVKPDTPVVSQTGEAVSGGNMTLRCTSTNGRPAPSITWSYLGKNFTYTNTMIFEPTSETYTVMSELQRLASAVDNGQLATCRVSHTTLSQPLTWAVVLKVKFGPSTGSTTITGNKVTRAGSSSHIRLNCTSGSSNPASNITWYNGSDVILNTDSYTRWSGDNNGVISSNILTITPTRYMDGDRIECMPHNGYGTDTQYVDLNVLYPPLIKPFPNISSIEGEPNVTLTCSVSSKPPSNFTWFKDKNTVITSGIGSLTDNSFSYAIPRVDRTDAGSYRCQAENNVGSPNSMDTYLFVKHPPTVKVSTSPFPNYTVSCKAEGYPDNYTYLNWVQIWPGYGPVATIRFTGTTLTLTDVTYERSGVYVCGASNGVAVYGTNETYIQGNATIVIAAAPVLTYPLSPYGARVPVAGILGEDATIEIKYWSNVDGGDVRCYKLIGGSRASSSSCSVTKSDTVVTFPVYNHTVNETGTVATIKMNIKGQDDLTDYDIVITNKVQRETSLEITIVSKGPPEVPILTGNFTITNGLVILTVLPGFHGGYNQTLVAQISTDLSAWTNNTSVNIGQNNQRTAFNLVNLQEDTLYHVRAFAFNTGGRSNKYSSIVSFRTTKGQEVSQVALIVGVVAGGGTSLLIGTVVIIICKRRKAGRRCSKGRESRHPSIDNINTGGVVECAMYESAGNVQPTSSPADLYSKPIKKTKSPVTSDLYASLSKPEKGNKTNGSKHRQKDVYENTLELQSKSLARPILMSLDVTEKRQKNANEHGLIYADLEFNNNPEKSVIHGLDDATTYVQVDFTKAADPLPDSDEEANVEI